MKSFAHVISSVFQPLLMPVYSIALLFVYTYFRLIYSNHFFGVVLPVIIFSFAVPAALIYLMYRFKLISDLSLKVRKERFLPYIATLLSYSIMIFYYARMQMPLWFLMLCSSSIIVMLIATIITIWWKISAHMIGVGGLVGGVLGISYFVEGTNPFQMFIALFIISGLVGTSRLILQRHTPAQVYAGFALGFAVTFCSIWLTA